MHLPPKNSRPLIVFIVLSMLLLLVGLQARAVGSQSNDPTSLSYQAFTELEQNVYRPGSQTPDLVAKLNLALRAIEDARVKRAQGDLAGAARLEDNATSILQSVLSAIPAAQEQAAATSKNRTLTVLVSIPIVVVLSTLAFYAFLWTWRYYEKEKLYEMRIVEKKVEG